MADRFSATQINVIDRDARNMKAAGYSLGEELNDLWAEIDSGAIGITADARDLDAVAPASVFRNDDDNTAGLEFYWPAFKFHNGLALVTVSASHLTLASSDTNYVEVNRAGTVSCNQSAFTSGQLPLAIIVTGVAAITSITYQRCPTLIGTAGVVGSMLSTAGATKETVVRVGTLSATDATIQIPLPNHAGTITRISIEVTTTVAANDTDYWTFGVVNKGSGGGGSTVVVDGTAAANSTKSTGGSALTNFVQRDLTLTSTPADLVHAAKDTLLLTCTKASSGANLVALTVRVESTFTA